MRTNQTSIDQLSRLNIAAVRCFRLADFFITRLHPQLMHYASAMFYGGDLIDATDADYDSFKDLGLLCPVCKEGVFLQGISQRQQGDKSITIPAHFKHFKAKDPALAKLCEARVAKYDAPELQQRAAQARNQRQRLLQRRFWGILIRYYEQIEFPVTRILESDGQQDFMLEMGSRELT